MSLRAWLAHSGWMQGRQQPTSVRICHTTDELHGGYHLARCASPDARTPHARVSTKLTNKRRQKVGLYVVDVGVEGCRRFGDDSSTGNEQITVRRLRGGGHRKGLKYIGRR